MSSLNGSDSVVDPSLIDAGFVIQSRNTLDLFGNILTSEVPVGTGSDPNGDLQTTLNVFDDLGRLTKQTLLGGKYLEYQYDSAGNEIRRQDSLGQWAQTSFDALSRPLASGSLARGLNGPNSNDAVLAEWTYRGLSTIYKNRNGWETTTPNQHLRNTTRRQAASDIGIETRLATKLYRCIASTTDFYQLHDRRRSGTNGIGNPNLLFRKFGQLGREYIS